MKSRFHIQKQPTGKLVAVWREEKRLIVYNGDLAGRVISVDADAWSHDDLRNVIASGEKLLNIGFGDQFKSALTEQSLGSVYIVQDCCYRACKQHSINETASNYYKMSDDIDVKQLISNVIDDQGARYNAFLTNFPSGFQDTNWKYLNGYPILTCDPVELEYGLSYKWRQPRNPLAQSLEYGGTFGGNCGTAAPAPEISAANCFPSVQYYFTGRRPA